MVFDLDDEGSPQSRVHATHLILDLVCRRRDFGALTDPPTSPFSKDYGKLNCVKLPFV